MSAAELQDAKNDVLARFKAMLKEEDKTPWGTDSTLRRFLKAREFNLEDAYKMYTSCLRWRKENNIDKVLDKEPEKLAYFNKLVSCKFHGFDKLGRPVYIERVGKIHYPTLLEFLTVDDLVEIHIWQMEVMAKKCAESGAKLGKDVHKGVNIVDLEGLSMSHRHGLEFIRRCAKIDEQYYPETMGKLYIINAPRLFPFFWGICKAWVHPNTQKKIQVLAVNHEKVFRENIPLHFLAAEYGGKCTCGQFDADGNPKKVKTQEGKVEKEVFCVPIVDLQDMKDQLKYRGDEYDSLSHQTLSISAGTFEEVKVEGIEGDKNAGSLFTWNFKTVAKNIEFSVVCHPKKAFDSKEVKWQSISESKLKDEIPASAFSESFRKTEKFELLFPEKKDKHKGVFRSPVPCTLVFKFDNSYSWMTGKTVRYKLTSTCLTASSPTSTPHTESES
ncbi:hypothetical protein AAMO2058_000364300 [Amorphochlora amoebiformis]